MLPLGALAILLHLEEDMVIYAAYDYRSRVDQHWFDLYTALQSMLPSLKRSQLQLRAVVAGSVVLSLNVLPDDLTAPSPIAIVKAIQWQLDTANSPLRQKSYAYKSASQLLVRCADSYVAITDESCSAIFAVPQAESASSALSVGAIVGIAIAVAAIAALAFAALRYRRRQHAQTATKSVKNLYDLKKSATIATPSQDATTTKKLDTTAELPTKQGSTALFSVSSLNSPEGVTVASTVARLPSDSTSAPSDTADTTDAAVDTSSSSTDAPADTLYVSISPSATTRERTPGAPSASTSAASSAELSANSEGRPRAYTESVVEDIDDTVLTIHTASPSPGTSVQEAAVQQAEAHASDVPKNIVSSSAEAAPLATATASPIDAAHMAL